MSLSTKTLNTRVIQKHDTEANWALAVNFIPKKGEIIIYDVDSTHTLPRFKIGNGTTVVSNLPFCDDQIQTDINTLETKTDELDNEKAPLGTDGYFTSKRNFENGTLITTNIDYSVEQGAAWLLELKGNSYTSQYPFDLKLQGYIYISGTNTSGMINYGGICNGYFFDNIVAFCYNGVLCFWFPYIAYWQGFDVRVTNVSMNVPTQKNQNCVVSITDEAKPTEITKEISFVGKIVKSVTSDNISSQSVAYAVKAGHDVHGQNIANTYETKTDANTKLTQAKTFATDEANRVKNELLNGAGGAYDTLKELGDLIDENVDAIEALETVATNKADKNHEHTCADITDLASTYETQTNASQKLTEAKGYTDTLKSNLTTGSVIPLRSGKADYAERDLSGNVITSTYVKKTDIKNGSIAITIPAGRMCGDVNGDGKITEEDADIILNHVRGIIILTDQIQLKCADVDNDNSVSIIDANLARMISNGTSFAGEGGDVLENWISNPNYETEDMQFYIDIPIEGITSSNCATITISGTYKPNFFKAECINGAIRIYAKLCPLSAINAIVQYGVGNGTAIVIQENSEVVDLTSNQSINGIKSFNDGIKCGDAQMKYDYTNRRIVFSFE